MVASRRAVAWAAVKRGIFPGWTRPPCWCETYGEQPTGFELIGSDRENYGFIQVSDRLSGDFTAQDEANLVRMASLTATALDALAQLHLPEYRTKAADLGQ